MTVALIDLSPKFSYTSVPRLSPHSFLQAKAKNTSHYAMLAGPSNIFLDNNFIAKVHVTVMWRLKGHSGYIQYTNVQNVLQLTTSCHVHVHVHLISHVQVYVYTYRKSADMQPHTQAFPEKAWVHSLSGFRVATITCTRTFGNISNIQAVGVRGHGHLVTNKTTLTQLLPTIEHMHIAMINSAIHWHALGLIYYLCSLTYQQPSH